MEMAAAARAAVEREREVVAKEVEETAMAVAARVGAVMEMGVAVTAVVARAMAVAARAEARVMEAGEVAVEARVVA